MRQVDARAHSGLDATLPAGGDLRARLQRVDAGIVRFDIDRYLRLADRLLPERIVGFYLVGSVALGGFRPGRSDIDFVSVVSGDISTAELRRLRVLHAISGGLSGFVSSSRGWSPMVNTCNGVFIREEDLTKAVSRITPIASHTGRKFVAGGGFDVNPVIWKEFAERGIVARGPAPKALGLRPEPNILRDWCLQNLSSYWTSWAKAALAGRSHSGRFRPRWATAWGTLGSSRLHCTIATGEVISKQAAGEYALETFDSRWHPVITEGLEYWAGQHPGVVRRQARGSARTAAEFVLEVVRSAQKKNSEVTSLPVDGEKPAHPCPLSAPIGRLVRSTCSRCLSGCEVATSRKCREASLGPVRQLFEHYGGRIE